MLVLTQQLRGPESLHFSPAPRGADAAGWGPDLSSQDRKHYLNIGHEN